MASVRFLRYLAPNLITLSSMIFGLVSLWASHRGNHSLAAWMIIYAVLTDRMDGLVARAVKGTSELGMQLDSFADMLNFGVAPPYLVLTFLNAHPDLPFADDGTANTLLWIACGGYMLCAVFRLARYNILSDETIPTKMFFGFPTTLAGGTLAIWFLLLLKYDAWSPDFGGAKLFGDWATPLWMWKYFPIAVAVFGYLMASRLPMPKVGMTKNKPISVILLVLILFGYTCGFAMHYPELIFWMPTVWAIAFLIVGQVAPTWRAMYPPPLFPKKVSDQRVSRPQADIDDIVLDESPGGTAAAATATEADAKAAKPEVP